MSLAAALLPWSLIQNELGGPLELLFRSTEVQDSQSSEMTCSQKIVRGEV